MSDTCIVCLGDLRLGHDGSAPHSSFLAKSPATDDPSEISNTVADAATTNDSSTNNPNDTSELIAHIQPCGHDLHNACLTPWVERANSCPICRATFNLVELMHFVGGSVISSYLVKDRTQVAELDPSLFLELPDEDEDEPCQACGESDSDDVLMYCDGCDKLWHTYCVDLQEVPRGAWYCSQCLSLRDARPQGRRGGASRRRTRGQQRRLRSQQMAHDPDWNDIWHSIFSQTEFDVDFPNDEDEAPANAMRRLRQRIQANRVAQHAYESRLRVAELVGAGHAFREQEAAILNGSAHRARASPHPYVETPEETDAWNAFEEARAPSAEPSSSKKRKRKPEVGTKSPAESEGSGPLQVKRKRVNPSKETEPSPRNTESPHIQPLRISPVPRRIPLFDGSAPSFLQSLLQEVEDSSSSASYLPIHRPLPRAAGSPPTDHSSPHPSSPAISPSPSNHSSPRAMSATPPPFHARPTSPTGLSSSIQPVFPTADYSPLRSSPEPKELKAESPNVATTHRIAQPRPERPSRIPQQSPSSRRPKSTGNSPVRNNMSLTAKSDVQKLVSAALKPHYNEQKISKDEYTIINRDISRMLYEKIGDFESLDLNGKAKWEKVAGEEVNKAVGALRAQA